MIDVTRLQIESSVGLRSCWERNVDGMRIWGMGQLVDAVGAGTAQ